MLLKYYSDIYVVAEKRTLYLNYRSYKTSIQTRKIAIILKIVQIKEKSYFAKTVCKLNQMLYSGLATFYMPIFASRLLLNEVIC